MSAESANTMPKGENSDCLTNGEEIGEESVFKLSTGVVVLQCGLTLSRWADFRTDEFSI